MPRLKPGPTFKGLLKNGKDQAKKLTSAAIQAAEKVAPEPTSVRQRLKPCGNCKTYGTVEAVPITKPDYFNQLLLWCPRRSQHIGRDGFVARWRNACSSKEEIQGFFTSFRMKILLGD